MSAFALLPSLADLVPASAQLSDFLALRSKGRPDAMQDALLGIWIDPYCAAGLPRALPSAALGHVRRVLRIRETAGMAGLWTVCWLDVPHTAYGPVRRQLLDTLLSAIESRRPPRQPQFIPVFPLDAPSEDVSGALCSLASCCSGFLLPPLYQDLRTGRLETLTAHAAWPGIAH